MISLNATILLWICSEGTSKIRRRGGEEKEEEKGGGGEKKKKEKEEKKKEEKEGKKKKLFCHQPRVVEHFFHSEATPSAHLKLIKPLWPLVQSK